MNRFLRNIFFVLAILCAAYAAGFGNCLLANQKPLIHSKIFLLTVAGAVFLLIAGWKFSVKTKFKVFAVLLSILLIEFFLQATSWLGILPGVNIAQKVPYGRVYWTAEGRGNGVRNRFGWYYPTFDLAAAHKIAFIGNSQVEGLEVSRSQNEAAVLNNLLKEKSPDRAVLGFGNHGACPANAIDMLDYVWKNFQTDEAVVMVTMGNDLAAALPKLYPVPPSQYIFYNLDAQGNLVLNPDSAACREGFNHALELSGRSILFNLPFIVYSHCMILQTADSLRDSLKMRTEKNKFLARNGQALANGFNNEPFAVNPSPDTQLAMTILLAELQQCKNICDSHAMKFRIVTLPAFPKAFYDSQHGTNWTTLIGDYDYFGPERKITAWAQSNGIPVVSIGQTIEQKKLSVDEIRSLYFLDGTGHLTPKGHAFIAQTVFEDFYNEQKK